MPSRRRATAARAAARSRPRHRTPEHAQRHDLDVRGEAPGRRLPALRGLVEQRTEAVEAQARPRRDGQHAGARRTVHRRQPSQVGEHGVHLGGREPVGLVERQHQDLGVPCQRAQVALVQHGVGVLLRVHHPDEQVDAVDEVLGAQPVLGHH